VLSRCDKTVSRTEQKLEDSSSGPRSPTIHVDAAARPEVVLGVGDEVGDEDRTHGLGVESIQGAEIEDHSFGP
jgi:hypothetical protein